MRSRQWIDIDRREATVTLQEPELQGTPNRRVFNLGSAAANLSISSSDKRKLQLSLPGQKPRMDSVTKFRNFVREDKKTESAMAAEQLKNFSVSLTFVCGVADAEPFQRVPLPCDARRCTHGRASGSSRWILSRDGKMDVGTTRGGAWEVAQWDRLGSWMRWWTAASDRRPIVQKLLSDDPDRRTKEDTASLRSTCPLHQYMRDRCSRGVGESEIIWARGANRLSGASHI